MALTYILAEIRLDYETLMAALLHEVIEDTQDIEPLLGHIVAELAALVLVAFVDVKSDYIYCLKEQRFHSIMDISDVDTCYRVLGKIHSFLYKPRSGLVKDYIAITQANYYPSLHHMAGQHIVPV